MKKSTRQQRLWIQLSFLTIALFVTTNVRSDETPSEESTRTRKVELVKTVASRHQIAATAKPDNVFQLRPEPILYWTNPTRGDVFGGIFLWVRNGRPMAFGGTYLWFEESGIEMTREFHSLAEDPLTIHYDDNRLWAPERPGVKFQVIPKSKPPAASRIARARQFKTLASRFSATISQSNRPTVSLRRLARPIYRYPADTGVLDGAILAFVEATDPEAMLLIEARESSDSLRWHYAFARCTAWEVTARLDGKVVYEVPSYDFSGTNEAASPFFISKRIPLGRFNAEAGSERLKDDRNLDPRRTTQIPNDYSR